MKFRERARWKTEEQRIGQQNTYDEEIPLKEVNVELMNIKNVLSGLTHDEITLTEEVTEHMKTNKIPLTLRDVEKKWLKSRSNEVNRILNYILTENITPKRSVVEGSWMW